MLLLDIHFIWHIEQSLGSCHLCRMMRNVSRNYKTPTPESYLRELLIELSTVLLRKLLKMYKAWGTGLAYPWMFWPILVSIFLLKKNYLIDNVWLHSRLSKITSPGFSFIQRINSWHQSYAHLQASNYKWEHLFCCVKALIFTKITNVF